jgi:hypothetical protein
MSGVMPAFAVKWLTARRMASGSLTLTLGVVLRLILISPVSFENLTVTLRRAIASRFYRGPHLELLSFASHGMPFLIYSFTAEKNGSNIKSQT